MRQPAPVRIGVIGAGSIFRDCHLPQLSKIEGVSVTAVCNRSEQSSRRVAEAFGIRRIESDWRALIGRDDIDAVFIGTWPYRHREMSIAALAAGKHVFCQARMAMDLAEARAMVAAAEARPELVNMVCPPPTRMPWEPYIREVLREQTLGRLLSVRVESTSGANLDPAIHWRERVEYSGRQALQLGILAETLNAWVGGYESLVAVATTPIPTKTDADGGDYTIRVPQIIDVVGTLATGVAISEHHSGVEPAEPVNRVTLVGADATLRVDLMERVSLSRCGGPFKPVAAPQHLQRPWRVERDFIDAVRAAMSGAAAEDRPVSPDFAEALGYMKKVEAVHLSAERGQRVVLSDL